MLQNVVALLMLATLRPALAPSYWGGLTPGPRAVGFTQRWVVDSTRRLSLGETHGLRMRPVLLNLWYPVTRASGSQMPYSDYFEGALRAAATDSALADYARALISYSREVAWRELAGAIRASTPAPLRERIDSLFRARSVAYRDAPLPSGTLPVVVYTQGTQSSLDDNVVLCEYLASLGYLVIGSAFPQEDNTDFTTNANDESRQRDIRRLLLEVARLPGIRLGTVTVIGHSAGAQAMQMFAADPSAPIDAVLSLDTTQDYATLTDRTWAYFTDRMIARRKDVRVPMMFIAGPAALFELADSLVGSPRWLVTVPGLTHNDFISQGIIRLRLRAGLADDEPERRDGAERGYAALLRYLGEWLDPWSRSAGTVVPDVPAPLEVTFVPPMQGAPPAASAGPCSARDFRHLFGPSQPKQFARAFNQAKAAGLPAANNDVLVMLFADAVRRGTAGYARAIYRELLKSDPSVSAVRALMEARARLFERFHATEFAADWRGVLRAFDGS